MKRCPTCQAEYPADANWCRFDGGKLELVAATKPAVQPSALTMGWDVQEPPTDLPTPTSLSHVAAQPGALTMGWDVPNVPMTFTGVPPPA